MVGCCDYVWSPCYEQKYDCLVLMWQDWSVLNFSIDFFGYLNELEMEFDSSTIKYSIV